MCRLGVVQAGALDGRERRREDEEHARRVGQRALLPRRLARVHWLQVLPLRVRRPCRRVSGTPLTREQGEDHAARALV
jgi:hypothetical protein